MTATFLSWWSDFQMVERGGDIARLGDHATPDVAASLRQQALANRAKGLTAKGSVRILGKPVAEVIANAATVTACVDTRRFLLYDKAGHLHDTADPSAHRWSLKLTHAANTWKVSDYSSLEAPCVA